MKSLQIEYPDELLTTLNETEASFNRMAYEVLLVKLYELGRISSGLAASALSLSRREFLDLLGRYGVSYFDEEIGTTLLEEARIG
jgi:predicted HTH domain antitoxin